MCARIWKDRTEGVYSCYIASLYSKTRSPSFSLDLVVCLYMKMKSYQLRCIDKSWYFLIKYRTLSSAHICVRALMKSYQLLCNTSKHFFTLFFFFSLTNKRKISCHFVNNTLSKLSSINQIHLTFFFLPWIYLNIAKLKL